MPQGPNYNLISPFTGSVVVTTITSGTATILGNLNVASTVSIGGNVTVLGNMAVASTMIVGGNATILGNMTVASVVTANTLVLPGVASTIGSRLVPLNVDDSSFYRFDDIDQFGYNTSLGMVTNGTFSWNANSIAALGPLLGNQGVIDVQTTGAAAGGSFTFVNAGYYNNSSAITWQWRAYFMFPTQASSAGNRYVFTLGPVQYNSGNPSFGPYIQYTDNVNSGNWVIGNAYGTTLTTGNTSTAVPATSSWNTLKITLNNGIFNFFINGSSIGTLTDANLTSTMKACCLGMGIMMVPSSFVSATHAMIDSFDTLITGITR